MRVIIRKSRPEDAPALADLWHEMARFHARQGSYWRLCRNSRKAYAPYLQEVARARDKAVFVARADGAPVGYVLAQLSSRARIFVEKNHGLIVDLAVTKRWRRQGVGERLFRRAVRWLKSKGVRTVEVRISTANPVSTAFWRKRGFEPYMTLNKKTV